MNLSTTTEKHASTERVQYERNPSERDEPTSNEMRHDWLADRWVIIAPQRTERPDDFIPRPPETHDASTCPFCFGREDETPSSVLTFSGKSSSQSHRWSVRVFPNKFPAVNAAKCAGLGLSGIESQNPSIADVTVNASEVEKAAALGHTSCRGEASESDRINLFRRRSLFGGHEVVVESPEHLQSITELDREKVGLVFRAYRDRVAYWMEERSAAYVVVFKNVGHDAGASLTHSHSQIIATDIVPTDICRVSERMKLYKEKEGSCLFCSMIDDELDQQVRVVEQTPDFVAICPFASRLPSQVTIVPKTHQSRFEQLEDSGTEQLSWLTHRLIRRIEKCYPETPYNFVIHTAPRSMHESDAFHWRMELFPRLTKVAGFEWGSDCYINPLAPEEAAANLRRVGV